MLYSFFLKPIKRFSENSSHVPLHIDGAGTMDPVNFPTNVSVTPLSDDQGVHDLTAFKLDHLQSTKPIFAK